MRRGRWRSGGAVFYADGRAEVVITNRVETITVASPAGVRSRCVEMAERLAAILNARRGREDGRRGRR